MPRRYLLGPVTANFPGPYAADLRPSGACLTFGAAGTADLVLQPQDDWQAVRSRFPAGWQPDFVVLCLAYTDVPAGLWTAPVPLIGVATDWDLLWHYYRQCLPACDLVVTDAAGAERLGAAGIPRVHAANLNGAAAADLAEPVAAAPRDLDVLFVGNLNPAAQRARLPWVSRLAALAGDWQIAIHVGIFGDAYRRLLRRARIVFNHTRHGECNRRVFEAVAAGALLFQEADNREVPTYLRDRQECVYYTAQNLEALLRHYLTHEDERQAIAAAGRARVAAYPYAAQWAAVLALVEREWPALMERAASRVRPDAELAARCWQALGSSGPVAPTLLADLEAALAAQPRTASLHNLAGLVRARAEPSPLGALAHFRQAVECDGSHVVAHLNLVEALMAAGHREMALEQARHALTMLEGDAALDPAMLEGGHYPPAFDLFRVEWERAAWAHAGQAAEEQRAKGELLRWRLHVLCARLSGDLAHAYEAALTRPDLAPSRRALGTMLLRAGRPREAIHHLRRALAANPFDREAARALFEALGTTDRLAEQRELVQQRRRLAQAAAQLVPAEPWFATAPARPRPAATPPSAPRPTRTLAPVRVSLCLIVRDEEANLPACLGSAADLVDEIIVVDTGSQDATREIAARFGARVCDFPWCDNFAAARNEGLEHATGKWILWLDADDRLSEDNRQRLRSLFHRLGDEIDAYAMKVRSGLDPGQSSTKVLDQVRLFRNHAEIRWKYRVHEQILPAVNRLGGSVRWTDVVIDHAGYQDPALRRRKLERNLRLLHLEEAEQPDDAFTLFNLGWTYQDLGDTARALPLLRRSLERAKPTASIVRKLYVLLTETHRKLGEPAAALAVCREGSARFPDDAELLSQEAFLRREAGDLAGAETCLTRLLALPPTNYFASMDAGLRGYKARHQLALVLREQRRPAEAEAHWNAVVAERPDFTPAWLGLGDLYLAARRWNELERVARGLEMSAGGAAEAVQLRARGQRGRQELLMDKNAT